jgi:hypothetical protein
MDDNQLTYKNPVWWYGVFITTFIVLAITVFFADVINGTPDDS